LENKFSISLWIKVNEHNHKTEQSLIDHRYEDYSSLTGFQLRLESTSSQISNQLDLVFIGIIDKSEQKFIVYNCIDRGKWIHIVLTLYQKPRHLGPLLSIYIDGLAKLKDKVAYDKIVDNKRQLAIGNNCYWAKNSHIFNYHGYIKEVSIWNYALSSDEITNLFNNVTVKELKKGLIAYWPFKSTTQYNDLGPNKLHGTPCGVARIIGKSQWEIPSLVDICIHYIRYNTLKYNEAVLTTTLPADLLEMCYKKMLFMPVSYTQVDSKQLHKKKNIK